MTGFFLSPSSIPLDARADRLRRFQLNVDVLIVFAHFETYVDHWLSNKCPYLLINGESSSKGTMCVASECYRYGHL